MWLDRLIIIIKEFFLSALDVVLDIIYELDVIGVLFLIFIIALVVLAVIFISGGCGC